MRSAYESGSRELIFCNPFCTISQVGLLVGFPLKSSVNVPEVRKLPRATTNVQKNKSYVGLFISYVGLFISYVGLFISNVGLIKSYVGLYKSYVGDKKSYVGDKKSYVGV